MARQLAQKALRSEAIKPPPNAYQGWHWPPMNASSEAAIAMGRQYLAGRWLSSSCLMSCAASSRHGRVRRN